LFRLFFQGYGMFFGNYRLIFQKHNPVAISGTGLESGSWVTAFAMLK
jgi:hypothetical protein